MQLLFKGFVHGQPLFSGQVLMSLRDLDEIRSGVFAIMAQESKAAVMGATAANFAIAAIKLAIGIGGSAAMLSEGLHSAIDGVNDLLLLYGLRVSKRPADDLHPFGYGKDLYFWSLIVSLSVFSVGGGVTIFEGVRSVLHPSKIQHAGWAYGALACGLVFDAASLVYGMNQFNKQTAGKRFWRAVRESKDPTMFRSSPKIPRPWSARSLRF